MRQVREILAQALGPGIDLTNVADNTPLVSIGADSTAALQVITELDIRFGVVINDLTTAINALQSIETLADFVEAHRQK